MKVRLIALGVLALVFLLGMLGCYYVIEPGERGVQVTLGTMSEQFLAPGLGLQGCRSSPRSAA